METSTEKTAIDMALAFAADLADAEDREMPSAEAERTERHLTMLRELAAMGMDLARAVHRQGMAEDKPAEPATEQPAAQATLAFSRVAKTVRQCLALEARVADQQIRRERGEIDEVGELVKQAKTYQLAKKKRRVRRAVTEAIEAEKEAGVLYPSDAEKLFDDLGERLEDERLIDDLQDLPVGECIARLCRKLGVTPDWIRWQREDWAAKEIAAKPKGSPYAGDWQVPIERPTRPRYDNPYLNQPRDPAGPDPNRRW